ncbi:MAG: MIP/aquaporin family protein [Saprospiraceae bacterium]|nr:aquaporin family protein [Saprospiraceae bacterium]MCB9342462.1 aquaporin family protein [Lewinellaceae bacterium]
MEVFLSELIGTALLILLGNGVVAGVLLKGSKSEHGGWIVITLGWGLAVTFAVFTAGALSGAHLNPAVTLALAATGQYSEQFTPASIPVYILAQMLGAMLGAALVYLHYLPHWSKTEDQGLKLAVFCNAPAIRHTWANVTSEFIGTFVLLFGICAIGANKFADGLNPIVVGALVLAIGLSLGGPTGYAINPARDLGPRITHALLPIPGKGSSDWSYSWIPVLGPILGGIAGAMVYQAVFP